MMTVADEEKSLPKRLAIFQRSTNFLKEILHILPKSLLQGGVDPEKFMAYIRTQIVDDKNVLSSPGRSANVGLFRIRSKRLSPKRQYG